MGDWLKKNGLFILVAYLLVTATIKGVSIATGSGFSVFGITLSHDEFFMCLTTLDVLAMFFSGWVSRSDRKAADIVWRSLTFYASDLARRVEEKRQKLLSEECQRKAHLLP